MDVTEQERKKKGNKRDKPEHDSPTNEERVFQRSKVIDRTPTKTEINRQQQNTKMEEIKTMIQQLSQDFKEEITKFKREIKEDIQEIKDDINILKTEARQNRKKVEDLNGKICKVEREWTREKNEMNKKLAETEDKIERMEKTRIRNNIIVTGIEINTKESKQLKEAVARILNEELNVKAGVNKAYRIGVKKYVVELTDWESKIQILKTKKVLKGKDMYIESELTREEMAIQKKIRDIAREERKKGAAAKKSDYLLTLNQQINETETKLKHRKHKVILVATWNVRTLYQAGKLRQALHEMENYGVEIMGISEARWKGVGEISVDRYKIIYSGQDETTGEHMNGVAIILNNKVRDSLISWEPVNDRIITARINMKNNNFTVVQCYAPTNVADIEDKEVFYSTLNRTMGSIPKEDIVLLMGDFNAKVGTDNNGLEDIMGKNGIGEKNENGEMMVELCGLHQLKIGGTLFKHKNCHKITWVSPDKKVQNQIDHICISEAWCNNLLDTRNKRGADIETDHYLVVAKIRAELQVMKKKYKPRVTKIFDIQKLNKEKFKERFIDMLREKEASIDYDNKGIQDVWQHCKDAFLETSKQVLGYKSSKKREWMSQDTWNKIKERRELKKRGLSAKTRENYDQIQKEYSKVAADIKKKIKRDKRAHMESIAQEAQKAAERGDTRTLFNNVRRISGTKRSQKLIKDKNGKVLTTTEEQLQRWTEYFKETLNMARTNRDALTTAKQPELQINTEPPTIEELKEAIQSCKNGKAPGIDQIRSEMLKVDTDTTAKMLLPLFRRVWIEEVFPDEWKTGVVQLERYNTTQHC
ncbi:hypothetical protein GEV33_004933 [Tenebrio molitor]|uniref:Endonuclease/exonuclease/phosphatase domain-containing protein n=1 Tax=Tenebrio molitor TaxID=7067 RepID=A0A8J6HPA7_TENMO|nr:hypothetical protein GEV33_004933 [Tenebrio molitor]